MKRYFVLVLLMVSFSVLNAEEEAALVTEEKAPFIADFQSHHVSRTFYKITKNGQFHGYLLGSMHFLNGKAELKQRNYLVSWLKLSKTVFFEVPIKDYAQKDIEVPQEEKAWVSGTECIVKKLKTEHSLSFEEKSFNEGYFNAIMSLPSPYFLHSYDLIKEVPRFTSLLKCLVLPWCYPMMMLSFLKKNISKQKEKSQKDQGLHENWKEFFIQFVNYYMDENISWDGDYYSAFMFERNCSWIEMIKEQPIENPTMYVVGAGHLPGPYGLLDLLEQAGYEVQAISLYSNPENPLYIKDTYVKITPEQRAYYDATRMTYTKSLIEYDGKNAYAMSIAAVLKIIINALSKEDVTYYDAYNEIKNPFSSFEECKKYPSVYVPAIVSLLSYLYSYLCAEELPTNPYE